ncbi:major facilitator transporter [Liquorilactobacillus ghanensis DSM 18630]|uniref:Major facilitator transporter n=1 Tax=Liquorilactobacillus ghanensis DSM 18630 TaxID=1423750 RepID=A0A0R1VQQ3_9LACO|nr:MFS transporter [Liquorilactobacillus ghanensis]KRM06187.1 major facilitator transporter [Liquorilactobacillus ghanensis DSM 18630]
MKKSEFPTNRILWFLTFVCALAVANLYYDQVLLTKIIIKFNVSAAQGGALITVIQVGYTLGLLLIVPLGDKFDRKKLVVASMCLAAGWLVAMTLTNSFFILKIFGFLLGLSTVSAQLLIPFVAANANKSNTGEVTGKLLLGVFLGVLIGRVLGGWLGQIFSWRIIHWMVSLLLIICAILVSVIVPIDKTEKQKSYAQILKSLPQLIRKEFVVRETMIFGAAAFAAFNIFWVPLTFILTNSPYHFDSGVVGTFGLIGIAGAFAAGFSGRLADRPNSKKWNIVALGVMLFSFILLKFTWSNLFGLIIVTFLLDIGSRMNMTLNQGRIYHLAPKLHSRLNSLYMVSYYFGGSLGSWLGSFAYQNWGVMGLTAIATVILALSILYAFLKK